MENDLFVLSFQNAVRGCGTPQSCVPFSMSRTWTEPNLTNRQWKTIVIRHVNNCSRQHIVFQQQLSCCLLSISWRSARGRGVQHKSMFKFQFIFFYRCKYLPIYRSPIFKITMRCLFVPSLHAVVDSADCSWFDSHWQWNIILYYSRRSWGFQREKKFGKFVRVCRYLSPDLNYTKCTLS